MGGCGCGQALNLLGKFISVKEPNIRYLGLEALGRFAQQTDISDDSIKKHMSTVMVSLRDADVRWVRHTPPLGLIRRFRCPE